MRALGASRTSLAPGGVLAGPWVRDDLWRRARAVPSLDLRFADNKSLTDVTTGASLVTFTRASSGTFVGSDGVLRSATTNIIWPSEDFTTNWGLASATRVADAGIAPNGTLTADRIESTGGGVFRSGVSVASGVPYTYSVYLKHVSGTGVLSGIGFERFGSVPLAGQTSFNVLTGTVVSNGAAVTASSITPIGDGWYRVSVRATSTDTTTTITNYAAASGNQFLLWGAQLEQSSTANEYIPTTSTINSAPRFDHDPQTGESLGLLVEEPRTNGIRNNTMVGAVAGTPGTPPTNWANTFANGITREIVGTGTEDGIAYIDVRFSGTNTLGSIYYQDITFDTGAIAAAQNQSWTQSAYVRLLSGAISGASFSANASLVLYGTPGFNDNASVSLAAASNARLATQRFSVTKTFTNALTTGASPRLSWTIATGGTIDFTLRIGLPQLEQGAFATSVIPTTTAAATRSTDLASITGTAFSSWYRQDEGTMFADSQRLSSPTASEFPQVFFVSDGTGDNTINLGYVTSIVSQFRIRRLASNEANMTPNASTLRRITAGAYAANSAAMSEAGAAALVDTSVVLPSTLTQLNIGTNDGTVSAVNGTIRRLTYWPTRLGNEVLQRITQ